jgi:hypothetical protein
VVVWARRDCGILLILLLAPLVSNLLLLLQSQDKTSRLVATCFGLMPPLVLLPLLLLDLHRWLLLPDRVVKLPPLVERILDASEAGLVEAVDGVAS